VPANAGCPAYTTVLRPFFGDHPGEPVQEENFWTLWCKGRLTEADTDHLAERHSIRTNKCPLPSSLQFFTGRMPFLPPNRQCQSTEGLAHVVLYNGYKMVVLSKLYEATRWLFLLAITETTDIDKTLVRVVEIIMVALCDRADHYIFAL